MSVSPARLALAAALASGAVLVLPASASAAPKQCAVGKWRLTGYSLVVKGQESASVKGGAGTKLTITPKKFTYDFNGSKKVTMKARVDGAFITIKRTYRKQLSLKAALKGAKKGKFTLKEKSATGNAVVKSTLGGVPGGTENLVKSFRKGEGDPFVPTLGNYTCNGKALKVTLKATEPGVGTGSLVATYRRI